MGLWDDVFCDVKSNSIRLPRVKTSAANAKDVCAARFNEVEGGFVEGFWGGKQDLKIPAFLAEVIDSLTDLAGVYNTLAKSLTTAAIWKKLPLRSCIRIGLWKKRLLSLLKIRFCRGLTVCSER